MQIGETVTYMSHGCVSFTGRSYVFGELSHIFSGAKTEILQWRLWGLLEFLC